MENIPNENQNNEEDVGDDVDYLQDDVDQQETEQTSQQLNQDQQQNNQEEEFDQEEYQDDDEFQNQDLYQNQDQQQKNSTQTEIKKDFQQKNLEYLEKIKEKQQKIKEELQIKAMKKQRAKEKLKKKILDQTGKVVKERNTNQSDTQLQLNDIPPPQNLKKKSIIQKVKSAVNPEFIDLYEQGLLQKSEMNAEQLTQIEEYEQSKQEKIKLKQIYKQRYQKYIEKLTSKQTQKKQQEEEKKKKNELLQQKLKKELNLENVGSKLQQYLKNPQQNQTESKFNKNRSNSLDIESDNEEKTQEQKEKQKKLLQKQMDYIKKINEQKQQIKQEKELEEQKKEELKNKLKEFVLVQIKKEVEQGTWYGDDDKKTKKSQKSQIVISENLNGLDLETNKPKKAKALHTDIESAQKEKEEDEDNEDDEENEDNKEDGQENNQGTQKKKKVQRKIRSYPFITDLEQWKKKQRLPPETKVFIIIGGYQDLRDTLKERGWIQNPDIYSPCFDLKWTLRPGDIDFNNLKEFQVVNHFDKIGGITTKIGLCRNLRNLVWFNSVDIDSFYPRCYSLNDPDDYDSFCEDFKLTKAETILKKYMRLYIAKDKSLEDIKVRASVALDVCTRRIRDLNDIIDDHSKEPFLLVSDKEWEILSSDELDSNSLAVKKHKAWLDKLNVKYGNKQKQKKKKKKSVLVNQQQKKTEDQTQQKTEEEEGEEEEEEEEEEEMDEFTKSIKDLLAEYKKKFSQFDLNGENNIWIVKPAALSRGRGITCYNNLIEIQDHVKSKEVQWVIQKYIENPLILQQDKFFRKFDIRAWVLVTDFNPLTIWYYTECYIRISATNYDVKDLSNKYTHLTNNSISKKYYNGDIFGEGNMISLEEFQKYLQSIEQKDVYIEKIEQKMINAMIWAVSCVQDSVSQRKNSHEMFGFDFMIDENYNVWLIEVNSSPAMDYSTTLTERLVKQVLKDLAKVIVDYPNAPKKKGFDTGLWKKIYKAKEIVDKPINNQGLNLCLEGVSLKKTKQSGVKVQNVQLKK